ncbi:PD-(D/E)XK motif protein [Ornithinimicrobium sp. Arc0846-15]|nr:PD-(D/E)XK motif protein [Ornithinimicrobium laminariae]
MGDSSLDKLPDGRHLTLDTLLRYWKAGRGVPLVVDGTPPFRIVLDPEGNRLTLTTPFTGTEPDLSRWQHINFLLTASDSGPSAQLEVDVTQGGVAAAYSLAIGIADLVQLKKQPLAAAISTTIKDQRELFDRRGGLSEQEEIGLVGELLLLEHLMNKVGPGQALAAWVGPRKGEHDFVFTQAHLEVKTTKSQDRIHVIHGLGQLVPHEDVALMLISTQISFGAAGHGATLPQQIARLRQKAGGNLQQLNELLTRSKWRDDASDLHGTVWSPRSTPRAYLVGSQFPALTSSALANVVPQFGRITHVEYRINVTDLKHSALPGPLEGYVEAPKD